jgi:hypothetical protein
MTCVLFSIPEGRGREGFAPRQVRIIGGLGGTEGIKEEEQGRFMERVVGS